MKFSETALAGAYQIELEPSCDERGFFSRSYCDAEFAKLCLTTHWPQENLSQNIAAHTLRGMHFNDRRHAEEKVVQCVVGAIYDVIVDIRPESSTRFKWFGTELTAQNRRAIYIPQGFAHGFLTLLPNTEVRYRMGRSYEPDAACGFRWDDPRIAIDWPAKPAVISDRDASYRDIGDWLDELT